MLVAPRRAQLTAALNEFATSYAYSEQINSLTSNTALLAWRYGAVAFDPSLF
jgi:hypothetical protein